MQTQREIIAITPDLAFESLFEFIKLIANFYIETTIEERIQKQENILKEYERFLYAIEPLAIEHPYAHKIISFMLHYNVHSTFNIIGKTKKMKQQMN